MMMMMMTMSAAAAGNMAERGRADSPGTVVPSVCEASMLAKDEIVR